MTVLFYSKKTITIHTPTMPILYENLQALFGNVMKVRTEFDEFGSCFVCCNCVRDFSVYFLHPLGVLNIENTRFSHLLSVKIFITP